MTHRCIDFRRVLFLIFAFVMVFTFSLLAAKNTLKTNAEGFDPGNIISDAAMRDYNSLSEADIQNFLKSKNSCNDTNLSKTGNNVDYLSENSPYSWHVKDGHYVCMADETFNGGTAAQIIYRAAQDYHINPKVLIVLLEKEQSLVRDTFPNSVQYRSATGYGCPDTAACDSKYYGLNNQIRNAAAMFNDVLNGGWTNYPVGNNYIQYNPKTSCGGSTVFVRNLATSALYRYTPYQPGGDANSDCAAYGNLNFYNFYTNWFGSTQQVFKSSDLESTYLPDGTYNIVSAGGGEMAIDVENYGTTNGTNIQIFNYSKDNKAQQFKITRESDGFYKIASIISGKVLDVSGGSVLPGANLQLHQSNGTCAQKWAISYDINKHFVFRSACSGNSIDVNGGATNIANTNVQSFTYNKTVAQEWDLVSLDSATVADGDYSIVTNTGYAIDIAGGSTSNGANVQLFSRNFTNAQVMHLTRLPDGFYSITNPQANKAFDVRDGSTANGANIQIWGFSNTCPQRWAIESKPNGFYVIRNACSGNVIDVSGGAITTSGANIQSHMYNGTNAQMWMFLSPTKDTSLSGGTYYLKTHQGLALDVVGASKNNGANIQIYAANQTKAQEFKFELGNDGYYTITNTNSNKVIDVSGGSSNNGANIQIHVSNGTCAQKWLAIPSVSSGYYTFRNACSGKTMDVSGGYIGTGGANVQLFEYNSTIAQQWLPVRVQ
ncbi:RICIN domain-containing protein [Candidatus Saccharibacteria bacterium]|nr:RICIN domain-containing protein [Candidatus Saccharibacteria bacterium]